MVDLDSILSSWYDIGNRYRCFFKPLPFTTLEHYISGNDLEIVACGELAHAGYKAFNPVSSNANVVIVDLPAEDSIDLSVLLNKLSDYNPVLMFSHLFHKYGLVGSMSLASKIISYAGVLQSHDSDKFSLILDYNRYTIDSELATNIYDNQYELTLEDFPSVDMLKDCSCGCVTVITKTKVKADLQNYLDYLNSSKVMLRTIIV